MVVVRLRVDVCLCLWANKSQSRVGVEAIKSRQSGTMCKPNWLHGMALHVMFNAPIITMIIQMNQSHAVD